jgi:hypothetical protein
VEGKDEEERDGQVKDEGKKVKRSKMTGIRRGKNNEGDEQGKVKDQVERRRGERSRGKAGR